MSLTQDKGYLLNHMRAQYLATVDDEQARRVIRPYPHHYRRHDTKEFNELLTRIESPPIPVDVMVALEVSKRLDRVGQIMEESEGEEEEQAEDARLLHKTGLMDSIRSSLATLKISDSNGKAVNSEGSDSTSASATHLPASSAAPYIVKRQPSVSGKNVLSKLFRNTSSSSTIERRTSASSTLRHSDDDDEFDEDDEDDDDDISISTNDNTSQHPGDETNLELNEDADTVPTEDGILVDQNYSDVNNTGHTGRFNDDRFLFGDSLSSGDDDLLLDSDFSDDDGDVLDDTFPSGPQMHSLSSRTPAAATPSRSSNRRLSFDKVKPKLRRRAETVVSKRSNDDMESPVNMTHSYSTSNIESVPMFEKVNEIRKPISSSNLSALFPKKAEVEETASLGGFLFVSGGQITNKHDVMKMKVWLPDEDTLELDVRKSVKVFDAIGYILLNVLENKPDLLNDKQSQNPNRWCLKLVDDDGEPYEGSFGLLDRTKLIGTFGSDEFALCPVNESEFESNEARTPYIPSSNGQSGTPSPVKNQNQNNYYKSIIPKIDNDVKDSKKVTIEVYEHPYDTESTNFMSIELLVSNHINDILVKFARLNSLDANDYVLKPVGEDVALDLNDDISSLDGNYKLEILTKRKARVLHLKRKTAIIDTTLPTINSNLTPQTLVMKSDLAEDDIESGQRPQPPQRSNSRKFSSSAPKFSSSFKSRNNSKSNFSLKATDSQQLPPTAVTGQYLKFTVWRRLPMSFINRHERTLAIDGEYVYIMPNDERNWYDTNFKNTTFHVSQIVNCKVSRRVPTNFKIVVMKSNGPKRYVFEAMNAAESRQIIDKLQTLKDAYKINTQSVT